MDVPASLDKGSLRLYSRPPMPRVIPTARALLCAAALAVTGLVFGSAAACDHRGVTSFHNVRLGMTPVDVRDRFDGPAGTWKNTPGEEMLLDYSPASGGVPKVRFEFHNGMLVAVRATLDGSDPMARGAPREVTPGSVASRETQGANVTFVWLSRDCPTHKEEAARLAAGN